MLENAKAVLARLNLLYENARNSEHGFAHWLDHAQSEFISEVIGEWPNLGFLFREAITEAEHLQRMHDLGWACMDCPVCGSHVSGQDQTPNVEQLVGTIKDLVRSLKLAQEDAQRYRWLKSNHLQTGPDSWIRTGDDLEEAIDVALAASTNAQQSIGRDDEISTLSLPE